MRVRRDSRSTELGQMRKLLLSASSPFLERKLLLCRRRMRVMRWLMSEWTHVMQSVRSNDTRWSLALLLAHLASDSKAASMY